MSCSLLCLCVFAFFVNLIRIHYSLESYFKVLRLLSLFPDKLKRQYIFSSGCCWNNSQVCDLFSESRFLLLNIRYIMLKKTKHYYFICTTLFNMVKLLIAFIYRISLICQMSTGKFRRWKVWRSDGAMRRKKWTETYTVHTSLSCHSRASGWVKRNLGALCDETHRQSLDSALIAQQRLHLLVRMMKV
jgi:hypothetical protein